MQSQVPIQMLYLPQEYMQPKVRLSLRQPEEVCESKPSSPQAKKPKLLSCTAKDEECSDRQEREEALRIMTLTKQI